MSTGIGIALMGCGRIAQRHAQLLTDQEITGARLVAICDIKPERVKEFKDKYGAPGFVSFADMIAARDNDIDAVCILTESGNHADNCLEVAAAGKHVIVEKPMALTLDDADRMIEACDRAGVKLLVVKQNRFNKPVRYLRKIFEEGRFGKMVMGSVRVRWRRDQYYYDQDEWRGTWAWDGGVFSNQASHHVDLLQWFLGEPVTVYAKSRTALVDIEAEDTGVAIITFKSGAIGVVEATTAARPDNLEGSLSLLGRNGTVVIGGFAVNKLETWRFEGMSEEEERQAMEHSDNPPNVYGFGHKAYLNQAVQAIQHNTPSLVDGLEGRKSLELISAIYESIETGKEVTLRFQPNRVRLGLRNDV